MGQVLARARDVHYDGTSMVKKLRAMVHSAEEQVGTEGWQECKVTQWLMKW